MAWDSWDRAWERLVRLGLGEPALQVTTSIASLCLFLVVVWVMGNYYVKGSAYLPQASALTSAIQTPTPTISVPVLNASTDQLVAVGITRTSLLHTTLPTRSRDGILTYTVKNGDSLFGIAEAFGLQPQTLLWGNYDVLADDPERLSPGQNLNILPTDGVLYKWNTGDGLSGVAKFFGVTPDAIIDWPGNNLDRATIGDLTIPNIKVGTLLVIPGGKREFTSWSAPRIVRSDPSAAKGIGAGACTQAAEGPMGGDTYIWPTTDHTISGYGYAPEANHPAIDIGGQLGNPVLAVDNGVIVYAGWSDLGYGNMIMVDHGDGWQSLYAHLSQILVGCGQSVYQGDQIGAVGSTGNSTGPHLHFELRSDKLGKVNPLTYLPQ
jgi:murein DD-endopeptidase MepM/ murein hydrolase activator NlpD